MYTRSTDSIYLSLVHTGSCEYLFHEIPCSKFFSSFSMAVLLRPYPLPPRAKWQLKFILLNKKKLKKICGFPRFRFTGRFDTLTGSTNQRPLKNTLMQNFITIRGFPGGKNIFFCRVTHVL